MGKNTPALFPRELRRVGHKVLWYVPVCRRTFADNVLDLVDSWPGFSVSEYGTGLARRGQGYGVQIGMKKGTSDNYILPL